MKCLLLDGFNLAFRAYHAMPELTRADGFPTGALQGWVRILWKLQEQAQAGHAIVFFDKGGSRRHLEIHPQYKANRAETPPALAQQIPELKTIAVLLGFQLVEESGVEADDLIASAATRLAADGDEVRIASADKDFAQLVNERIRLLTPPAPGHGKEDWRELDEAGVREKFGVGPAQIVDYLSLVGDTVDNIPGLPGVGAKTAAAWLGKYGSIEGILAARDTVEPVRHRKLLGESGELLERNRRLITFLTDLSGDWRERNEMNVSGAIAFFNRFSMSATLREFERRRNWKDAAPKAPAPPKARAAPQAGQLELF
ncbi:MAG: hypothetical protein LBG65_02200 [Puniceicoccales bacterium]|jgi:DNA polymerase-1|nr:hypothetical protein [Puniceicoccales bacterium]